MEERKETMEGRNIRAPKIRAEHGSLTHDVSRTRTAQVSSTSSPTQSERLRELHTFHTFASG